MVKSMEKKKKSNKKKERKIRKPGTHPIPGSHFTSSFFVFDTTPISYVFY
jgi:hypothetical protein